MKTKFTLILLVLTLSLCVQSTADAQVNVQDSLALVDFYNSTDGLNWKNNSNWLNAEPLANWHGVLIKDNRIVQIELDYNNLKGIMPCSLGNLSNLTDLTLYGNKLRDSIPSCLGNLVHLNTIDLSHNHLTGKI